MLFFRVPNHSSTSRILCCRVAGRNLNGDDDHQGRYLRMPSGEFTTRRVRLYTYH